MKVILFGATGMVGQGVLRECLLDPDVERVLAIGRSPTSQRHDKLRELVLHDFSDFSGVESELSGYDACFFCLGVSSAGMTDHLEDEAVQVGLCGDGAALPRLEGALPEVCHHDGTRRTCDDRGCQTGGAEKGAGERRHQRNR